MAETLKGGLDGPKGMMPMDQILLNAHMPIMRELYANTTKEQEAHKKTLRLLQEIIKGEVDPSRVTVTDDGWQMAPPRPSAAVPAIDPSTVVQMTRELADDQILGRPISVGDNPLWSQPRETNEPRPIGDTSLPASVVLDAEIKPLNDLLATEDDISRLATAMDGRHGTG